MEPVQDHQTIRQGRPVLMAEPSPFSAARERHGLKPAGRGGAPVRHAIAWTLERSERGHARLRHLDDIDQMGQQMPGPNQIWLWLGKPSPCGGVRHGNDRNWPAPDAWISEAELARSRKFHFARDSWSYVAAHAGLRAAMGQILGQNPAHVRFAASSSGKPALDRSFYGSDLTSQLHFNLSHTAGLVVIAIAATPVGVDVEHRRQLPNMRQLVQHHMPQEALATFDLAQSAEEKLELFFRFWTLGESFIKATGLGLAQGLDSFAFTPLGTPRLTRFSPEWGPADRWQSGYFCQDGAQFPGFFAHQNRPENGLGTFRSETAEALIV